MRKLANYRLPLEVLDGIKLAAEAEKLSQTAWVERVIRRELGLSGVSSEDLDAARERRERLAERKRRRQESKNEWKRRRRAEMRAAGKSAAGSLALDLDERESWVARRVRELERQVPSAAARRALALREYEQMTSDQGSVDG